VHAAGGHALIYGALGRALAGEVTIAVIQARGFDGVGDEHEAADAASVDRLADRYLEDVRAWQPSGPYALGGASFGGLVAYEMARRLRAAGEAVPVLMLFDSELPTLGLSPVVRALSRVPGFRTGVYPRLRRAYSHGRTIVRGGPRAYAAWLRRGGMRGLVTPSWRRDVPAGDVLLDGLARVRVANERALADYIPRRYDGPLLYCRARDVTPSADDTRGRWAELCAGTAYREVPGTHHTMLLPPHVEALAVIVREALDQLARSSASGATRLRPRPHPPTPLPAAAPQPASQPHPTA
jgi:thioesterase domain-containing protein